MRPALGLSPGCVLEPGPPSRRERGGDPGTGKGARHAGPGRSWAPGPWAGSHRRHRGGQPHCRDPLGPPRLSRRHWRSDRCRRKPSRAPLVRRKADLPRKEGSREALSGAPSAPRQRRERATATPSLRETAHTAWMGRSLTFSAETQRGRCFSPGSISCPAGRRARTAPPLRAARRWALPTRSPRSQTTFSVPLAHPPCVRLIHSPHRCT